MSTTPDGRVMDLFFVTDARSVTFEDLHFNFADTIFISFSYSLEIYMI